MSAQIFTGGDPSKVSVKGYVKGDLLAANAGGSLTALHVGADNNVLTADSVQALGLVYGAGGGGGGGTPSNTVVTEQSFGQASTAGVATTFSRGDHTHGTASGGTFTTPVTVSTRFVETPVALTDQATIATDASLGNAFRVTLGGNRTLGAPTNAVDGQMAIWEITQDGSGNRTLALASGAGGFSFGADIASITLSTGANLTDFIGARYNSTANRWRVIAFVKGY